ncbi:MAG: hypothetical protein O2816_19615 [Planctomycetota bacterium]|nr:hypothetical protein [Planctomycetota bacterium]
MVGRSGALIGFALFLLPACSTCRERRESAAPQVPEAIVREPAVLEAARPAWNRSGGEVRRMPGGFEVDLTLTLRTPDQGIVLVWAGDFEGRPARNHPTAFDSGAPVGFPWRPGTQLWVPAGAIGDGTLDLYVVVITATEPGWYEVCADRAEIALATDAARIPFDLDPRPMRWEDLRAPVVSAPPIPEAQ